MRLLLVHPGASWAVHDVHTGLLAGLRAGGHTVTEYALSGRLHASRVLLEFLWRRQVRTGGPLADVRPTPADVQYHAGKDVVERALRDEVDWVLVVCAAYLHPDAVILCRRAGLPVAAVFTESPYDDPEQAKIAGLFDVVFTNERRSVDGLRQANPRTHYLPTAYDPAQHGPHLNGRAGDVTTLPAVPARLPVRHPPVQRVHLGSSPRPAAAVPAAVAGSSPAVPGHDVVFVGTGFDSRVLLLSEVDWTGIDLGLYGAWERLPKGHPLAPYVRTGLVDNARTGALYRAAKIGLNLYRGTGGAPAESLNPRAYELAADGVFTISHPRAEVAEKFGWRVPRVADPGALEAQVRRALTHDDRRRSLARGLPALVADDTYHHRAAQLVAHLADV